MTHYHPTEADHAACRKLVDGVLIASAQSAHKDAATRFHETEKALTAAEAKRAAAEKAAEDAAAGKGSLSPVDAEAALAQAELEARAAKRVRDAAERARDAAAEAITHATRDAQAPVIDAGLALRVRACAKADRARALLEEAQIEYSRSAFMLNIAKAGGLYSGFSGEENHMAGRPVRGLAEEAPHWRDWRAAQWDAEVAKLTAEHADGYTTDVAGYAVGATTIRVLAGEGKIAAGDTVQFAGDANSYRVTRGTKGTEPVPSIAIAAPGLRVAISAAAHAVSVTKSAKEAA